MTHLKTVPAGQPSSGHVARQHKLSTAALQREMQEASAHFPAISLTGAAWDMGAGVFGSSLGPEALGHYVHFPASIAHTIGLPQPVAAHHAPLSIAGALSRTSGLCLQLAHQVADDVRRKQTIAVIGGDHSCAIGTWHGVAAALGNQRFGLIWIDAHLDAHTPQTSLSGKLHGMPLAVLLGHGYPELVSLLAEPPVLDPAHVAIVGVRSVEHGELELLGELGVRVYFSAETEQRGLDAVLAEAHQIVTAGSRPFGISIDLDAIDPQQVPGVNMPIPGGLDSASLSHTLQRLYRQNGFLGVEIAEFNPLNDHGQRTLQVLEMLLDPLLPGHSHGNTQESA
ncbi:MAG: arginase [Gammaproteobacteria bacterium]|nr:arginase [Gammaproteobacteria bacterium]MBU2006762.1 arginase [Gammaproteobacteria bacterium]